MTDAKDKYQAVLEAKEKMKKIQSATNDPGKLKLLDDIFTYLDTELSYLKNIIEKN